MPRPIDYCRHCGDLKSIKARSLCSQCYNHHADLYAPQKKYHRTGEPTLRQLERLIARQLPTMPPKQQGEEDDEPEPYTVPVVRLNPRGRRVTRKVKRI